MSNTSSTSTPKLLSWRHPVVATLAFLFFVLACSLVSIRAYRLQSVPGQIVDASFDKNSAFRDFHNAVYYPVRAFITGENPYSPSYLEYHPDGLGYPMFYPSNLVLHAPFGFLQVEVSQWVFLGVNFLLMLLVVWLAIGFTGCKPWPALVFVLSGFFILTRPGVLNYYGAQVTLMHVLGCLLALQYGRSKPALAALGLLLASCKPTFTIPLAILMLCRGNWKSVSMGTILSVVVGVGAVAWIASNNDGLDQFAEQFKSTYLDVESQPEIPKVINSGTRVDTYSILPRWDLIAPDSKWELGLLAAIVTFAGLCVLLEKSDRQLDGSMGRFGVLACLAVLISVYHQPYDALLLMIPLIALVFQLRASNPVFGKVMTCVLILLIGFPMLNFIGTRMVLNRLDVAAGSIEWRIIVTANAIALLAALLLVGTRMIFSRMIGEPRNA